MGFKSDNSNPFDYDEIGIVTGTVGSTNFPNIGCGLVRFKAFSTNVGAFLISHASGTSVSGWPIRASEEVDWVVTNNLNRYWFKNASGTVDKLAYWLQR